MPQSPDFSPFLLLIGLSAILATIFRSLRLPTIVGFILAGVIAGPSGFNAMKSLPGGSVLSEVTILLLMFTIGLEFSFKQLWKIRRSFAGLGLLQISVCAGSVMLLTRFGLAFNAGKSFLIGSLVAMSSTAIVMKLFEEHRETKSPQGNACFSILLFQDLAIIPIMLILPLFSSPHLRQVIFDLRSLGPFLLRLSITGLLILTATRYLVPFLFDLVARTKSREVFFFTVLGSCLGSALAIEHLGGSLSLGAFVAGMMISESPYGRQVSAEITPFRDSFLGLFFASIGMLLDVSFFLKHMGTIVIITACVIFIKAITTGFAAVALRKSSLVAVGAGLILAQIGEFSFVLAQQGINLRLINGTELQYILSVSVLTMIATPFIFQFCRSKAFYRLVGLFDPTSGRPLIFRHRAQVGKHDGAAVPQPMPGAVGHDHAALQGHVIIIGFGVAGQQLAQALALLKIPYVIMELNYEVVKAYAQRGEPILFGDALSRENLEHANLRHAKEVVVTASGGAQMLHGIVAAVRGLRSDVPMIIRTQYILEARELSQVGDNTSVVVGELETSLEILLQVLNRYEVSQAQIHEIMLRAKNNLEKKADNLSTTLRRNLDVVAWEALAALSPFHVKEKDFAVDQNLLELNLRARTGASVVAVYREGEGVTLPPADYRVRVGDVLHLIGTKDVQQRAKDYMESGCLKVAIP